MAAASSFGTTHAKLGIPCQDDCDAKTFPDKDGENVLVAVVSDGAGSAAKAEVGSKLTCLTVVEAVKDYLRIDGGKVGDIGLGVAQSWVGRVQRAIRDRAGADRCALRDYACTMLVAVVGHDAAAIMQIGDGATVVSTDDGWHCVHWPQHGEFANMTNFVTEAGAEEKLAFDLCRRRVDEVAMFSDGIERLVLHGASKTVFAPFFDRMFPAVRALEVEGLDSRLSESLRGYLDSKTINDKTDDDKTLVLATRRVLLPPDMAVQPTDTASEGEC